MHISLGDGRIYEMEVTLGQLLAEGNGVEWGGRGSVNDDGA
jgi:hypothetical protein